MYSGLIKKNSYGEIHQQREIFSIFVNSSLEIFTIVFDELSYHINVDFILVKNFEFYFDVIR